MIEATTPSSNSAFTSAFTGGTGLGRDEFLKLLVAQLQNQDPLSPMDGKEMAVQLAQFSSVEQLMNLNENIQAQTAANAVMGETMMASLGSSLLGREVLAVGNTLSLPAQSTVTVGLPAGGASLSVKIYDETGTEVGSQPLGSFPGGRQTIDVSGAVGGLPDGTYHYAVEAIDPNGETVEVQHYTKATIDGLRFTPQGLRLIAGGVEIPFANVAELGLGN